MPADVFHDFAQSHHTTSDIVPRISTQPLHFVVYLQSSHSIL
jgi:hypothetical protein